MSLNRGVETWWVTSPMATVRVVTKDGTILRESAPFCRSFIGQPLENFVNWLNLKTKVVTVVIRL